jgi:N-acyl-L-homoserine lactone synthetase
LIFEKIDELPTMKNFKIYDIERARMNQLDKNCFAEFSAFTKLQNHDVGMGLIKSVLEYSFQHNLTHWVCCLDQRVYNYMHRMFKFPFRVVGETQVYLGSTTIPCILNLAECLSTLKELRPALYDYLVDFAVKPVTPAEVSR